MKNTPYINRELSWLDFNQRVLEEAENLDRPPLDRLRFLSIFSSNLDEFFMVRISGLWSQRKAGYRTPDASGHTPTSVLEAAAAQILSGVSRQSRLYHEAIMPDLARAGLQVHVSGRLPEGLKGALTDTYRRDFEPILTPMAVDPGRPFPFLTGRQVHLLVTLTRGEDPETRYAIVPIPLDRRFIPIPGRSREFIVSEALVALFVHSLFTGCTILNTTAFRITRDAELSLMEDEAVDLLSVLEGELKKRERGTPLRLEIEEGCPPGAKEFLVRHLHFETPFFFEKRPPLNEADFTALTLRPELQDLRAEHWPPMSDKNLADKTRSIFEIIRDRDRLLHLPYESFDPVVRFLDEASRDPQVLAIKQTLYRTSGDSPVVRALKRAAANGKQVTVLVELKARFDEARNITWAKELEHAGCYVVYGLVGMKIHCKMLLVVRRERDGIRRYAHLATGNYNDRTAAVYTDFGLFTAKPTFGREMAEVFNLLTGHSDPPRMSTLVTSPLDLRRWVLGRISREADRARSGGKGSIQAKMNALVDEAVIEALYEASRAGVQIDLIVRGTCCLRPGVPGLSENIRVRSIIDRYLEHSRVFIFHSGGDREVYLASADWMNRNFDRRVETLFPVEDVSHRQEILDAMAIWLADNTHARILQADGSWSRLRPGQEPPRHAQKELYEYNREINGFARPDTGVRFIPVKRRPDGARIPRPSPSSKPPRKSPGVKRGKN